MLRFLARVLTTAAVLLAGNFADAGTDAGDLLWQDTFDPAEGADAARAVVAGSHRVVAVGRAENPAGNNDLIVRAYDARAGQLSWSDRVDVDGADDTGTAVVLNDERVVVAGTSIDAAGGPRLLLRAYVVKSGILEWEDRSVLAAATGLVMHGSRVVVSGAIPDLGGSSLPLLRVYIAGTGLLAWQDTSLPTGYAEFSPVGVAVHAGRVFAAGSARTEVGSLPRCVVRAYDLRTGNILWQSAIPRFCRGRAVGTDGKRVIVAAQGSAALDDFMVQAYDAETGEALWEDRTGISTGFENAAVAVDLERGRAFVAGWVRWLPGQFNQEALLVRAYDAETGALRWEDQYPGPSPFVQRCLCQARDLVVDDGQVFVVGQAVFAGHPGTWIVRAYDGTEGGLLWADEYAPVGGTGDLSAGMGAVAVAVDGRRVFVSGSGFNANGDSDFTVRVYDVR